MLEQELSRAPHRTRIPPIADTIVEEVISYKRSPPAAGYRSVANAIRQAHEWQPVIGPTKVRRVLLEAGLVKPPPAVEPGPRETAIHAPEAEQTVNIDLCVVPISHEDPDRVDLSRLDPLGQLHPRPDCPPPTLYQWHC